MDLDLIQSLLIRCTIVNVLILLIWLVAYVAGKNGIKAIHRKFFDLSDQTFDVIHYCGMATFKIFIFLFNIAPLIAISLIK